MYEELKLYVKAINREVKISVYKPDNNNACDVFYMFDGQNSFKDKFAPFGRSLRCAKHIDKINKEKCKNLMGVGIWCPDTDYGRLNEYMPFDVVKRNFPKGFKNDNSKAFSKSVIDEIIPFIESKYKVTEKRFLYGSSMGALICLYTGITYKIFDTIALFSTASFLSKKAIYKFLYEANYSNIKIYLYTGGSEFSDKRFSPNMFLDEGNKINNILKKKKATYVYHVNKKGIHNEASWEKQLDTLFNYFYE